jgi:hypothetical protein
MLTRELIQQLRREGHKVNEWTIRYAAGNGRIPGPVLDASLTAHWPEASLDAAREYLRQPRKVGRPRNTEG